MISERPRNIIVGLTILIALAVSMYGIILLGKLPVFSVRQYLVTLQTDNANGIGGGSRVDFMGVQIGQVRSAYLTTDAKGNQIVNVQILINPDVSIPDTAVANLSRPVAGVGQPSVEISVPAPSNKILAKNGSATMNTVSGDSGLIPKDVLDSVRTLSTQLTSVATDLHTLLAYTPPEALENINPNDPNAPRANASTVIIRLDRTMASLQSLLTDSKLQGQVRSAVQNIAEASAQLKTTLEKVDNTLTSANTTITSFGGAASNISSAANNIGNAATQANQTLQVTQKNITDVSQKLVETLGQLDKSIRQITDGNGTTGKLANDPRLYEGMLDLSKSLKTTVDDLDFLVNKWKDEGVNLRVK